MSKFYIEKLLEEVKGREKSLTEKDIDELGLKAEKVMKALHEKGLFIHDSGTYATLFIAGGGPVYFDSFFQTKSFIKMVLSFIENEDSYLDIPESDLIDMTNYLAYTRRELSDSYKLFRDFFDRENDEQERIISVISSLRNKYSEAEIKSTSAIFCNNIDDEISYIADLLQDLKSDKLHHLYFGTERDLMESVVNRLLAEKTSEKAVFKMKNQIQQEIDDSNEHLEIFQKNGFKLFDYLIKNHLTSGRGWRSEMSFYFRKMEDEGLLKCTHKAFWDFLGENYPNFEPLGKIKSLYVVDSDARMKTYNTAKKVIGFK